VSASAARVPVPQMCPKYHLSREHRQWVPKSDVSLPNVLILSAGTDSEARSSQLRTWQETRSEISPSASFVDSCLEGLYFERVDPLTSQ